MKINLCIHGRSGKLGSAIEKLALASDEFTVCSEDCAEVAIDVSVADALEKHIGTIPLIVGSTGHSKKNLELLEKASKKIPIMIAPNFSSGIQLLKKLSSVALEKHNPSIKILETHHSQKKDSPSGTSLMLAKALNADTITSFRNEKTIAEHTVKLELDGEEIEITHKAENRDIFAKGALKAAKFLVNKPCGIYTFEEVFDERS